MKYTTIRKNAQKRESIEVSIGSKRIGGNSPILPQSMCTTKTKDIDATVAQCIELAKAGCELIRITAPTVSDAHALKEIRKKFSDAGHKDIPISADIHFLPDAAMEAILHVEKVRINPGNFAEKCSEKERFKKVSDLLGLAKKHSRAIRLGINHGSLSARMMDKFGDTPLGMVESALEYIKYCNDNNFQNVVISMKSSNPAIMVRACRLLIEKSNTQFPLHLGVTEAGNGDDGRIKSAAGIGALLEDGIGDTIRVSLTEDPVKEIPVAKKLCDYYSKKALPKKNSEETGVNYFDINPKKSAHIINDIKIGQPITVIVPKGEKGTLEDGTKADLLYNNNYINLISLSDVNEITDSKKIIGLKDYDGYDTVRAYRELKTLLKLNNKNNPICLSINETDPLIISAIAASLLFDGIGDAIYLPNAKKPCELAFSVLQATKTRITRTEYIACPGCGRTLFDLQTVIEEVKDATNHLKGVTIAVMGCIVNGPGEMADADFGYIGAGNKKVTLYKKQTPVLKNIPEESATKELIELIKNDSLWIEKST